MEGLTEDAMPLQRASLGQVGYDADAVASLPAIIAAQIWIAAMRIQISYLKSIYLHFVGTNLRKYVIKHMAVCSTWLVLDALCRRSGWC